MFQARKSGSIRRNTVVVRPILSVNLFRIAVRVFRQHGFVPCFIFRDQALINLRLPVFEIRSLQWIADNVEQEGVVADLEPRLMALLNRVNLYSQDILCDKRARRQRTSAGAPLVFVTGSAVTAQKVKWAASCRVLEGTPPGCKVLMVPKEELPNVVLGLPRLAWLKTLSASARNSSAAPS